MANSGNLIESVYAMLRAVLYLVAMRVAYGVILGINEAIFPSEPWFIAVLVMLLILTSFWPVPQSSEWPMVSATNRLVRTALRVFLAGLVCFGVTVLVSGYLLGVVATSWPVPGGATESLVDWVPLILPLYGAWIEEVAFRGMMQGKLERRFGVVLAITVTTVFFVSAHVGNIGFSRLIPVYVVLSVLCGILASRSKSIGPAIGLHVLINGLMALLTLPGLPLHFHGMSGTNFSVLFLITLLAALGLYYSLNKAKLPISRLPSTDS
jgi:membrane protease YdiL (CAAX protease family)